jgi:hypothetical protein
MGLKFKELPREYQTWIAQMRRVSPEISRIAKLNRPVQRRNKQIAKANQRRLRAWDNSAPNIPCTRLLPLNKVAPWCQTLQDREAEILDKLREKTPWEWLADIQELPDALRNPVARIIWWDWFSHQKVTERWPQLDEFVNTTDCECADNQLVLALHSCGYSMWDAYRRIAHA